MITQGSGMSDSPDVTTFHSLDWVRLLPPDITARVSPDGRLFTIEWQGEINGAQHFFHVDVLAQAMIDPEDLLASMINNLYGARLFAEFGADYSTSFRWEAEAAVGARDLTERERQVIARRKELVWRPKAALPV
jgi:hypothetical protein